ncbi:MAG TPA: hypothetical protein VIL85_22130 [Thermomicrobiales bacterium]
MGDALGAQYGYVPPVDQLLTLGDLRGQPRYDYLSLGLRPEDVTALIAMAGDDALWQADSEAVEVWAPVHAWRALGDLRAEEAIAPLLRLLSKPVEDGYDDWLHGDMPDVFAQIGPAAIAPLSAYLRAPGHDVWARSTAASSLSHIALAASESRDTVVKILSDTIEDNLSRRRPPNEPDMILNGSVIAELIELRAIDTADVIARAFAAGRVDETISGDLEDVQIALGLRAKRDTPARNYFREAYGPMGEEPSVDDALPDDEPERQDRFADLPPLPTPGSSVRRVTVERKAKSKRKMAQQSRKQNRKKK